STTSRITRYARDAAAAPGARRRADSETEVQLGVVGAPGQRLGLRRGLPRRGGGALAQAVALTELLHSRPEAPLDAGRRARTRVETPVHRQQARRLRGEKAVEVLT